MTLPPRSSTSRSLRPIPSTIPPLPTLPATPFEHTSKECTDGPALVGLDCPAGLLEAFRSGDGVDLIRESVRVALQELIETEATDRIGTAPSERTPRCLADRNGPRTRVLSTKTSQRRPVMCSCGSPSCVRRRSSVTERVILQPRRRIDQALLIGGHVVVMEAYVHGVSTLSVVTWSMIWSKRWVSTLGSASPRCRGSARIGLGLDEQLGAFATRSLEHTEFVYLYLDATYLHVRNQTCQVVPMAVVVATGIAADGSRGVLGLAS